MGLTVLFHTYLHYTLSVGNLIHCFKLPLSLFVSVMTFLESHKPEEIMKNLKCTSFSKCMLT